MWKQSCGLVIAISNHYHHETCGVFFHFIGFICVQEKRWKRAFFASFSFQWIERRGRKRTILLKVFFSLFVSPILLFLFKKENKTEKHTHTHTQEEKINKCFSFTLHVLNYAEEKWQLEREEKQQYVRWQTSSAQIGCDTLSHACTGSVYVAFIIWKNFFPSVMFLTSSRWIYDVVYIGKVV